VITEFPLTGKGLGLGGIVAGSDGNLWFTESNAKKIGRITPTGQVAEFSIPWMKSDPTDIAPLDGGTLWFTERQGNRIGRLTP
jgi:virginiamycin B lyase